VDELLDVFYYINDIFHLKMASMNKVHSSLTVFSMITWCLT
jgi:hypothetical protein